MTHTVGFVLIKKVPTISEIRHIPNENFPGAALLTQAQVIERQFN